MSEISVPAHRNISVELQIHDLSLCFLQLIHIEQLATVPWKNWTKWLPTQEYFLHLNCVFLLDRCRVENSCDTCLLSQMRDKWENSISLQIVGANSTIILSINPWNHPYNHLQMTSRNQQLTFFSWCEQVLAMDAAIPSVCETECVSLLRLLLLQILAPYHPSLHFYLTIGLLTHLQRTELNCLWLKYGSVHWFPTN